MQLKNRQNLMEELSALIARTDAPAQTLFQDHRELLGFDIQWLRDDLARDMAPRYGLNADETEIVLIQVHGRTDCHLHETGMGVFRTLGPAEGFEVPQGGVLTKMYKPGVADYDLDRVPFAAGDFTLIAPYEIHALYAREGTEMAVLGVVSPRIKDKSADAFDVLEFDYTGDTRVRAAFAV